MHFKGYPVNMRSAYSKPFSVQLGVFCKLLKEYKFNNEFKKHLHFLKHTVIIDLWIFPCNFLYPCRLW